MATEPETTPPPETPPTTPEDNDVAGLLDNEPSPQTPPTEPQTPPSDPATPETPPETPPAASPEAPAAKAPETPAEPSPQPSRPRAQPGPDPLADELKNTLADIDADELLTPAQKRSEKLKLQMQFEDRQERRRREADDALSAQLDEQWRHAEKTLRMPRAKLEPLWNESLAEAQKSNIGGDLNSIASFILKQKVDATRKSAPAPSAPGRAKPVIAPRPGAVAPPAPSAHRPPAPTKDPGEEFDKSVTREDLASIV